MLKVALTLIILAALVYFVVRRLQGDSGIPRQPKSPPRLIAPDDDENFLRDLDFKRQQDRRKGTDPQPPTPPPGSDDDPEETA